MSVRSLEDLLGHADGRQFLEQRGVLSDPAAFGARLRPPDRPGLAELAGLAHAGPLVYVAHQLLADYGRSVLGKFEVARALVGTGSMAVVLLWLDTDRAGSDRHSMGVTWQERPGQGARLAPRRLRHRETRFVPVSVDDSDAMLDTVLTWVRNDLRGEGRERAERRLERLRLALRAMPPATLVDAAQVMTTVMLRDHLGLDTPSVRVSRLLEAGLLRGELERALARIDEFVAVFNESVARLVALGVDPLVSPLPADYLPLRYSCPGDGRRLPLRHERDGRTRLAAATCRCGRAYRFRLGDQALTIDELAADGRWSVDVTLPAYLTALVSGVVGGRSSALYGLVLNEVAARVLGRDPVPVLVHRGEPPGTGGLFRDFLLAP